MSSIHTRYDVAGNLTEYGGFGSKTYSFDPFNNMESKNSSDQTFRMPEEFYLYTADDERVLIWDKGPNIETIRLRGPGQLLLREYVNGGWTKDWIWRNGIALASVIPDGENEEVHHLIPDYLGSVRGITAEDGTVGPTPFFLPFGIPLIGDSTSDGEVVAYTGHERDFHDAGDTSDSLDYMHARHCSSHAGRFMSMDPVGGDPRSPQSWNRYSYVQNNPVNLIDPEGKETVLTGDVNQALNDIRGAIHPSLRIYVQAKKLEDGTTVINKDILNLGAKKTQESGNFRRLRQVSNSDATVEVNTSSDEFKYRDFANSEFHTGGFSDDPGDGVSGVTLETYQTTTGNYQIFASGLQSDRDRSIAIAHEFLHVNLRLRGKPWLEDDPDFRRKLGRAEAEAYDDPFLQFPFP